MNKITIDKLYSIVSEVTGVSETKLRSSDSNVGEARGLFFVALRQVLNLSPTEIAKLLDKNRSNVSEACLRAEQRNCESEQLATQYQQVKVKLESYLALCRDTDAELFRSHGKLKLENKSLRQENQCLRQQLNEFRTQLQIMKAAYAV